MKAIVIGAGIGGLSAAVALKQSGIDCDVYEAVKEIKPVGAAISVWPNGVKCMAHLGMGDIMETFGGPLRRMAYRDFRSGENMTQFSLAPLIERTGSRPCPVSRAELQREMLDYWGRDSVQFGKRVTRCEEDADGVTVWFTDGSSASGDLLIAADGSHSALRPWVLGFTPQRRYAGYVNWNGLVEIDEALAPGDQWTTFVGEGKRVSLMPVSAGRFYFFFDVPLPAAAISRSPLALLPSVNHTVTPSALSSQRVTRLPNCTRSRPQKSSISRCSSARDTGQGRLPVRSISGARLNWVMFSPLRKSRYAMRRSGPPKVSMISPMPRWAMHFTPLGHTEIAAPTGLISFTAS